MIIIILNGKGNKEKRIQRKTLLNHRILDVNATLQK